MIAGRGDALPVSAFPVDGTYPTGTAQWEKRSIAQEVPVWESDLCIQCGKCVMVCPHSTIRAKVYNQGELARAPESFKHMPAKWRELQDKAYTIQVAVEEHRCRLCRSMSGKGRVRSSQGSEHASASALPTRAREWEFFLGADARGIDGLSLEPSECAMLQRCLISQARARVAERTPYVRLVTPRVGDRASSPTRPAARASTAGICRQRPTQQTRKGAVRPGATHCLKTMQSSVSECGWQSITSALMRRIWSSGCAIVLEMLWRRACSPTINRPTRESTSSVSVSRRSRRNFAGWTNPSCAT